MTAARKIMRVINYEKLREKLHNKKEKFLDAVHNLKVANWLLTISSFIMFIFIILFFANWFFDVVSGIPLGA